MGAPTVLRVIKRPIRRLLRPLRLRLVNWQMAQSEKELQRLCEFRNDLLHMERTERMYQVRLTIRRHQLERG